MTDLVYPPALSGKRIRTYLKTTVQDVAGGPIRETDDIANPVVGRVAEQWPDGVVITTGNPLRPHLWVKAPFIYKIVT